MEGPALGFRQVNVREAEICRLCMKTHEYYLNVFVSNEDFMISIAKAIEDLLVLEVSEGDSLPETVCCPCVTKLMEFQEFKKMCVNSARVLRRHASVEPITHPVKVEVVDDEVIGDGERNKWNEFVEDEESAHADDASEALETGVKDGDAGELREEHDEIGEEDTYPVKKDFYDGATLYIDSSTPTLGDECRVKGEEAMESMVGIKSEITKDADGSIVSTVDSDPLHVGEICPVKDECVPMQMPGEVLSRNWSNSVDCESKVPVVLNDSLDPLALDNQTDTKVVYHSDPLGECDDFGEDIVEKECKEGDTVCGEVKQVVPLSHKTKSLVKDCRNIEPVILETGGVSFMQKSHTQFEKPIVVEAVGCDKLERKLNDARALLSHSVTLWDAVAFVCDACGGAFLTKSDLVDHVNSNTGSNPIKCRVCGKKFESKCNLIRHQIIHAGEEWFKCDVCGKGFNKKGYLRKHVVTHSDWKPFKCEVCGKNYRYRCELKRHSVIHSDVKPFKCDVCGKIFFHSDHLKSHAATHSGVKPFKCEICGKRFTQSGSLNKHSVIHAGVKPFKCEVCGKTFTQKGNLKNHSRIHTGVKPYVCEVCGKMFTKSTNLKSHSVIHTGAKPFDCNVCGKKFRERGTLRKHSLIHTGVKPFKCDVCGKMFTQKGGLNRHSAVHAVA